MAETSIKSTPATATSDATPGDNIDWNVDMEIQLFYAMRGHKPVGVNRHFQMACIHEKLKNSVQKYVTSQQIWDHLETMYDMAALHESEIVPFPNDETEFALPEEFAREIEERMRKTDSPTSTVSTATSSSKEDNVVTGRVTKELAVDDQGSRSALVSGHQTSGSSRADRQLAKDKDPGPSTAKESDSGAVVVVVEQHKRKRNARDQQSSSKSSNTPGTLSSSSSSKRRRN